MNNNTIVSSENLKSLKTFKYLKYVPKPVHIDSETYDLVDDDEFCKMDGRIPILMVTQYGIFPTKGQYGNKPKCDYRKLEGLENQTVGFVRRGYLSDREIKGIIFIHFTEELLEQVRIDPNNYNDNLYKLWKTFES